MEREGAAVTLTATVCSRARKGQQRTPFSTLPDGPVPTRWHVRPLRQYFLLREKHPGQKGRAARDAALICAPPYDSSVSALDASELLTKTSCSTHPSPDPMAEDRVERGPESARRKRRKRRPAKPGDGSQQVPHLVPPRAHPKAMRDYVLLGGRARGVADMCSISRSTS